VIRRTDEIVTKYYSSDINKNSFLPQEMYARLMDRKLAW